MTTELTRREMLKAQAAAIAASTAGIAAPAAAQSVPGGVASLEIKWSKAPCRFCGTGCGVMVGVKDNQVVASHGDMEAEVNRGLNCVKGYFLSKIMYGKDRLTTPLLRKRDGAYAKDGEVVCFFQNAQKFKTRYSTLGFSDKANLDDGAMWPTGFALKELTGAEEARIRALVHKATTGSP